MNPVRKALKALFFVGLQQQNKKNQRKTKGLPASKCRNRATPVFLPIHAFSQ